MFTRLGSSSARLLGSGVCRLQTSTLVCKHGYNALLLDNCSSVPLQCKPHDSLTSSPCHQQRRHLSLETFSYYYSPDFPPVGYAQGCLETVHGLTGLPWWGSILLSVLVLRSVVTLPVSVYSQRNIVKVQKLMPEIKKTSEELRAEIASAMKLYNWDGKTAYISYRKNMKRLTQELYERDNCHPFKSSLVMWVQLPVWVGMSFALRNMSGRTPFNTEAFLSAIHPELSLQGVLWFQNLIAPDPFLLLPVICGLTNLLNTEIAGLGRNTSSKFQKYVTYFYRGVSLIVIPIGIFLPSCMTFYWTCSSLFGLGQILLLKHPKVKQLLRIPKLPNETNHPYRDMWHMAKTKYSRRKS